MRPLSLQQFSLISRERAMKIYLRCCADVLLQDIGAKEARQKDVALTYAMAIKTAAAKVEDPDWKTINEAIIARWSMSGLERIKKMAWDICAGKIKP
jgi:hypothetical protein